MSHIDFSIARQNKPFDVSARGYHVIYREHEINHCPGCGRSHWIIGRLTAECCFCSTALPFAAPRFANALGASEL
jgi:hypothetical protein